MRELGATSHEEHDAVGRLAVRLDVSQLVVVGEEAKPIHLGASLEALLGRPVACTSQTSTPPSRSSVARCDRATSCL